MRRALAVAVAAAMWCACASEAPEGAERVSKGADARVGGEVVATVDGEPIRVADVARVVRATGLEPAVALRRLEDEILLAREAARRGYEGSVEVGHARAKASVQALLSQAIEQAVPPDGRAERLGALIGELERRFGVRRHEQAIAEVAEAPLDGLTRSR